MNNRGFTLVEMIVVIAIMGVALGIGSYSLTTISLANAKNCATEINSALERTRTQSCSSDSGTSNLAAVSFYTGSDGIYMKKSYDGSVKKIGGTSVSVTYTLKSGATATLGANALTFTFDRSSGAFRSVMVGGTSQGLCTAITVTSGGKTYTITCYPTTGKTKME